MIPFWPVPSSLNHRQYLLRLKAGSAFLVVQYFAYKLCFELAHQGHSWKFFFNNSKMHSLSSIEMLTKAKLHFLQKSIKMQFHHGQKEWGKKKVRDRGRRLVMNGFKIISTKFYSTMKQSTYLRWLMNCSELGCERIKPSLSQYELT